MKQRKMIRRVISLMLSLFSLFIFSPFALAAAMETNQTETASEATLDEVLSETGYVLVEGGVPRAITEEEYLLLMEEEIVETALIGNAPCAIPSTLLAAPASYTPGYHFSYSNMSASSSYLSTKYRVSPIFATAGLGSMYIELSCTTTRAITSSGGFSMTAAATSTVFNTIEANFSYAQSASISIAQGNVIAATYTNFNTSYTYCAIVFQPRVRNVTGTLTHWMAYNGETTSIGTYTVKARYSYTSSSGYLDGIYSIAYANSASGLPDPY